MWPRISIVAGLLAGVAVAVLVLGGILVMGPAPAPAAPPPPSEAARPSASTVDASPSPVATTTPAASAEASPSAVTVFHLGEPAPALVVPKVGGGTVDLADLKGKPVWVNFMGTYCPPCQDEFPLMSDFASRYADAGLVVVAVDVKEDAATIAAFADQLNATFPIGLDADGSVADTWGAAALPVHYWIDAEGIVRDGAFGGIGSDVMVKGLKTIMPDVDIQP